MSYITTYRDLLAWQEAMNLCELVYELTNRFPDRELYGLTSQLRRASVSILPILPKDTGDEVQKSYRIIFQLQKDHYVNSKHKYSCRFDCIFFQRMTETDSGLKLRTLEDC